MHSLINTATKRLACGIAAAAVAALTLSTAQAQELQTINVMTSNDQSCSPYPQISADEFGFFAKAGLKVNLLPSETSIPYIAFLANGDADIAMLDAGMILQAVTAGQPVSAIYEAYQRAGDGMVVPADSDIKSVADLKGKTIGMASDRDQLTTILALSTVGIDISEVTTVVVGQPGPVLIDALTKGTVQAYAAASSEFAAVAASGFAISNITPIEVSSVPGNTFGVWTPTMEEKRPMIEKFLRAWAMGQHAGIMDIKAVMSACKKRIPEQWEKPGRGETVVTNSVTNTQVRRTVKYGEPQRDVWEGIQPPYVKFGEIPAVIEVDKFLDWSFIDAANSFTTDEVKEGVKAWKEANKDALIN
jgi:NitT/TauT family transport system substrate-binding protein